MNDSYSLFDNLTSSIISATALMPAWLFLPFAANRRWAGGADNGAYGGKPRWASEI